jgi:hypothetical protein
LQGSLVTLHILCADDIKAWRGKHDFLFRVKMKAIELIAETYPENHVLFLDSDTTMESSPKHITDLLEQGKTVMHMNEKVLSESSDNADKQIMAALNGFTHGDYAFTNKTCMLNSGVVGLPASVARTLMARSIDLCDAMCETSVNRAFIEQLAIGMVLSKDSKLAMADNWVLHYWGNKPQWDAYIDNFLVESKLQAMTKQQEIDALKHVDLSTMPVKSRSQINNQRLKSLADKLFPKKRQIFFRQ